MGLSKVAPAIEVTVNGKPVASEFYTRLVKATIVDEEGQTSDSLNVTLDDADNRIEIPPKGAIMAVRAGWKDIFGAIQWVDKGTFKLEQPKIRGDDAGEFVDLTGKGWDAKTKLKGEGSEHFEKTTFGDIVRKLAKRNGLEPKVDGDLDKIPIQYKARHAQSEIDFLTRLTDDAGGILKISGNRLVIAKTGTAKSASGKALPKVKVDKSDCKGWNFEPSGRTQYGRVGAAWIDQKTGKRKVSWSKTGIKGPDFQLRETAADEKTAKRAADAEIQRLNRATGTGDITLIGIAEASAGADLETTGFRPEATGQWRVTTVTDEFGDSGWETTLDFKAREDGKKGGYKEEE